MKVTASPKKNSIIGKKELQLKLSKDNVIIFLIFLAILLIAITFDLNSGVKSEKECGFGRGAHSC